MILYGELREKHEAMTDLIIPYRVDRPYGYKCPADERPLGNGYYFQWGKATEEARQAFLWLDEFKQDFANFL